MWAEQEVAVSSAAEPDVQANAVAKQEAKEEPAQEAALVTEMEAVGEPGSPAEHPASPGDTFEDFLEKLE